MKDVDRTKEELLLEIDRLRRRIVLLERDPGRSERESSEIPESGEAEGILEALRESEKRYRQVVERAGDIIFTTDANGLFTMMNPTGLRMSGYTEDELIGRHYGDLIHPDYREHAERFYGLQFVKRAPDTYYEFPVLAKDGRVIWLGQSVRLLQEGDECVGFQSICRDITERKLAEDKLRESERRFRLLTEAAPFGLSVLRSDGRIEYLNPRFTEMFGYTAADIPDADAWFERAYPDEEYRKTIRRIWRRDGVPGALPEDYGPRIFTVRCKNGEDKIVRFYLAVLEDGSQLMTYEDISRQARTEKALQESEVKYRTLFESAEEAIFLTKGERFLECNNRTLDLFGCAQEQIIGRTPWDFSPPRQPDGKKSQAMARNYIGAALGGTPQIFEWKHSRLDGDEFDAEVSLTRMELSGEPFILAMVRDITERKRAERELREKEERYRRLYGEAKEQGERYRSLLNSTPDAIVIYDMEGRVEYVNSSFTRLFGWTLDELGGKTIEYVPEDEQQITLSMIQRALDQGLVIAGFETKRRTKDGRLLDVSVSGAGFHDESGAPAGLVVFLRDITERKNAESLLLQTERIKAVGEMAAGVAHNFNNLLQIVMGRVQMALQNIESGSVSRAQRDLHEILEGSRLGADTVKRLQDFARVRTEELPLEGSVFDLSDAVRAAVDMSRTWWKSAAEREGIDISLTCDLQAGCYVKGKENELFEVVVNLIKNAVEALPEGGAITVKTTAAEGTVRLSVKDDGVGIASENLGRVFEPFWTTKGVEGTGLGLAGSYGIVRRHGGGVTVESEEGRGAEFVVTLPAAMAALAEARIGLAPPERPSLRLLIVDDMEAVLKMLAEGLTEQGHRVYAARSGEEALRLLETQTVDIVVCDLGMPVMNGWQVGKALAEASDTRGVEKPPFVLLTGWGGQLDEEAKIEESRVDGVVEKPVDIVKLLDVIHDTLLRTQTDR